MMKGKKPKSPRMGCHDVEKRRWERVVLARIGFDFMKRITAMTKAMALTKMSDSRIEKVANLSLDRLTDTGIFSMLLIYQFFSKTQ